MIDQIIEKYMELRDKRKAMKEAFDTSVAAIDEAMTRIENHLMTKMQESGQTSMPTPAGTAYMQTRTSATLADKELFRKFCLDNDSWHLADIRAAPVAIREYREETDDVPPGVNFSQHVVVNIRKS